jgi:hypothetical protein
VTISTAPSGVISADASTVVVASAATGDAGSVSVSGGQLSLMSGAKLFSLAAGSGRGGAIAIQANNLLIDSGASVTSTTVGAGLSDSKGNPVPAGAGGAITVTAQNLTIQNGANVVAQSLGDGPGNVVAITTGSLLADGGAALNLSTGIFSDTAGGGNGGSISVVAGNLALHNGANVLACASGAPLCTGASSQGSAAGGELSVSVDGSLTVDSGASLGTIAFAGGSAGNVAVSVAGPIAIDMTGFLPSSFLDGIGSTSFGAGNSGSVSLSKSAHSSSTRCAREIRSNRRAVSPMFLSTRSSAWCWMRAMPVLHSTTPRFARPRLLAVLARGGAYCFGGCGRSRTGSGRILARIAFRVLMRSDRK